MPAYNDEIDLRPYILALKKNWWLIAIIAFSGAVIAFSYSYFQTNNYEATALVLLTRNKASLSLAEDFPTSNEPIDFRSRMDAMLALGESDNIFTSTYDKIRASYPEVDNYENFKNSVKISNRGDTIGVTVTHSDPEYAASVANLWAKDFITAINYAYSGEQLPGEIQANLGPARTEFNTSQADLEAFLEGNRIDNLQKQVTEIGNLLDELVQDHTWQVSYNIRRKQKMEQVVNEAVALREQIGSPNSSTAAGLGTALAILRLHAEAFKDDQVNRNINSANNPVTNPNLPRQETSVYESQAPDTVFNLQLSELISESGSNSSYRNDLDRIIDLATEEKQNAEKSLSLLTKDTLNVENDELITSTSTKLSDLRSQLEEETALLNELTSRRDLKLSAYQALAEKETEVRNNLQTSAIVTLVSPAVPPISPASRGLIRNTLFGGVLGFILGVTWVIGTFWLRSLEEPNLDIQEVDV